MNNSDTLLLIWILSLMLSYWLGRVTASREIYRKLENNIECLVRSALDKLSEKVKS